MDEQQFEWLTTMMKEYIDHKQPSPKTIEMISGIHTKIDKHFERMYEKLEKMSHFYTRQQCDERFASKQVEKNMNRLAWLVISLIIAALMGLIVIPN